MTKTARARYTLEFKQEAVRLVEGGQSRQRHSSCPAVLPHEGMLPVGWLSFRAPSLRLQWSKAVGMWAKVRAVGNA